MPRYARHSDELPQDVEADRFAFGPGIRGDFESLNDRIRNHRPEQVVANPARLLRRRERRDANEEVNVLADWYAVLLQAVDIALQQRQIHTELCLHELRASVEFLA